MCQPTCWLQKASTPAAHLSLLRAAAAAQYMSAAQVGGAQGQTALLSSARKASQAPHAKRRTRSQPALRQVQEPGALADVEPSTF